MENMFLGNACQNGLVPALVRAPLPSVPPSLGMKHFLPFPLESLVPRFNSMDMVQKVVLNHTISAPTSAKRRVMACGVCHLRFNSQSQALAHYKGTKHAKKLKSLDVPKSLKLNGSLLTREKVINESSKGVEHCKGNTDTDLKVPASLSRSSPAVQEMQPDLSHYSADRLCPEVRMSPSPPSSAPLLVPSSDSTESTSVSGEEDGAPITPIPPESEETQSGTGHESETEDEKALRLLYCSLCKVAVNSASQLDAHNSGTKHKTMLEARNGSGSIKSFPRTGQKGKPTTPCTPDTGLQNKTFHCETCDVHVNSETQLKQHISSRRHKDRAAGKPAKPKFSPYSKTQRTAAKQTQGKIPVSKDLCPPLTTRLIPSHLAAVAAATASIGATFPLRACHNPALFQTQTLPSALLRPAPGPIRTAHTPVLFAPY
ncbi:hypothetical protein DNTS_027508 [Danionella cerebrum]|uniref:C2H2-type domain-containing protein n=1 Tax=Danionella cerebrum TaxID=2873325 RepID=A0A553RL88_9TELE|nr:hypothetical protein DNTS_027508 [Danionella translucida]